MITAKELREKADEARSLHIALYKILDAMQNEALKLAAFRIRTDLDFPLTNTEFMDYTDAQKTSVVSALIDVLHKLGYGVSLYLDYYEFDDRNGTNTHYLGTVDTDDKFFCKEANRLEATKRIILKWCEEGEEK